MSKAQIHASALVSNKAELGADVEIGPFSIVEAGAVIGDGTKLHGHSYICGPTVLGKNCEVYPYAVLGQPPQDTKYKGEDTKLIIGDETVIREHVTMHPGTKEGRGETRVGRGGVFMVASHIAHDCRVGDYVVFANHAALAGHVSIGDGCILGGLSAVHQFCRVGNYAFVGSMAMVTKDVIPYGSVLGNHAHLAGLNIVGLKRQNVSKATIHELRSAYKALFVDDDVFENRLKHVANSFSSSPEVMQIVDFIRDINVRSLCMPNG